MAVDIEKRGGGGEHNNQPIPSSLPPSLLCLSKDFVVVLYRFSRRQRMCTRHDATPVPLPICPPSLNRSLFSSVGDMRAGERASERASGEREVIRKSCPSGTNSIRQPPPPPPPRSNNRQFMRRAPLLFTPQQRRRRSPMSASSVRPSLRLAMHEESDEIPLLLFLFFFVSLHHDDARKTVERAKKRRNERTNAETLSSLPFTVASRYT